METNRKLASIMFTDIVGYSTLMQIDEDRAATIRARHKKIFQETHGKYGGQIVQYFGDGTLSIFDSNVNAVECAVEMQIEFHKDPEVPLRIGIHSGDITLEKDDAYGTGMNIAARIEPICEPGGVFISERVYDDIKNHNWLRAVSLGDFRLKNIFEPIHIFAVSNKGISVPTEGRLPIQPLERKPNRNNYRSQRNDNAAYGSGDAYDEDYEDDLPPMTGDRRKGVAGFLALVFGTFGVHRFYLGQRRLGIVYFVWLIIAIFGLISTNGDAFPIIVALGMLTFLDAMVLWFMPQSDFDLRYNRGMSRKDLKKIKKVKKKRKVRQRKEYSNTSPNTWTEGQSGSRSPWKTNAPWKGSPSVSLIKAGSKKYKSGKYTAAKDDFEKSLEKDYNNPNVHFMLSCCYSILKKSDQAFFHLSSAVDFGFNQFEEVFENEGLEYLRSLPEFDIFVENDYKIQAKLPEPQEGLLESKSYYDTSILDKIADLGELMERGVINRDEFDVQKERILGKN